MPTKSGWTECTLEFWSSNRSRVHNGSPPLFWPRSPPSAARLKLPAVSCSILRSRIRHSLMPEAVIVSAARTPIGRAFRGAFNQTPGATMGGHVVKHAIERAAIDPAEVDDVVMGCGLPEGATGNNVGR